MASQLARPRKRWMGAVVLGVMLASLSTGMPQSARGQPAPVSTPLARLPFPQDDGSLTPYTFELGYPLVTLVYDTLMWRDSDGLPQPWLARSVETSADGRQVTIKLAEGARWHDGPAVTAADVAFTFKYVAEHPHPRFTAQLEAVERVQVADPETVVIALRHPAPGFLDQPLADMPILPAHLWGMVRKGQVAPDGLPVGSGPYRLVAYQPGESYRFEANADYFRGPPAVMAIEVPIMNDAEKTITALQRREVDMVPASLPEGLEAKADSLGIRTLKGPSYLGTVLMFNLRRPPFDQQNVRQAVAKAVDIGQVARAVGDAVPAVNGYLHPESRWSPMTTVQEPDAAAARDVFARSGLPAIEVLAPENDPIKVEAARQVALALTRAGVQAESTPAPREELSRAIGEDGSAPTFTAAIWNAPPLASHDPDFLARVFGSDAKLAALNYTGYRSAGFDDLARRIARTPEVSARLELVGEAMRLLSADLPVLPLFFSTGVYAYRPAAYDGWVFIKGSGILDKRSFLEPRPRPSSTAGEPVQPAFVQGQDRSPLGLLALAAVALAIIVAGFGLVRRR